MKQIEVRPAGPVSFSGRVPGSKSLTNRALVTAALADGTSVLQGASLSDDSRLMISALRRVGVKIGVEGTTVRVEGMSGRVASADGPFDLGNAGTAFRFFTSVATLGEGTYVLDGSPRMRERPIGDLARVLNDLGGNVGTSGGFPPVTVKGGGLKGGRASVPGNVSSQFLSSVMLCSPSAESETVLEVEGRLTSAPYADMTVSVMEAFGVPVRQEEYRSFSVMPFRYAARPDYEVEGDAAGAGYLWALAAVSGGRARVEGIGGECPQPEFGLVPLLERMGCRVTGEAGAVEVAGPEKLSGIEADMNRCPDSAQTLAVAALFAEGETRIRNVGNLRVKETDRLAALATELRKFGAEVDEGSDELGIVPPREVPGGVTVATYEDHRMAMAFSLVGGVRPVVLADPDCVTKSFPDYFARLSEAGVETESRS